MKRVWVAISVVVLGLLLLPWTWWKSPARAVTALSNGVSIDMPLDSRYGLGELEQLIALIPEVRSVRVEYGLRRAVLRVYPDSAIITITAPWLVERIRYPLSRFIAQELQKPWRVEKSLSPNALLKRVEAWVLFQAETAVIDQLVSFVNTTPHAIDFIDINVPARDWGIWSQSGQALDHAYEHDLLRIFLGQTLAPQNSVTVLFSLESEVLDFSPCSLAEAIIFQPQGEAVQVKVKGTAGINTYYLNSQQEGYWRFFLANVY